MTLVTPDGDITEIQELLTSVYESVRSLRREFDELNAKLNAGEDVTTTTVRTASGQLTTQLALCQKLETNLAECKRRQAGIAPNANFALDLEQARNDIGGRLAKLREIGCPGAVSE